MLNKEKALIMKKYLFFPSLFIFSCCVSIKKPDYVILPHQKSDEYTKQILFFGEYLYLPYGIREKNGNFKGLGIARVDANKRIGLRSLKDINFNQCVSIQVSQTSPKALPVIVWVDPYDLEYFNQFPSR